MQFTITPVRWQLSSPFTIARNTQTAIDTVHVELIDAAGRRGRGEAAGVDYAGETVASMSAQLESQRGLIESVDALSPAQLQSRLPAGGARNALDCAAWDLRAKQSGIAVWRELGLTPQARMACAYTIGIDPLPIVSAKAHERRTYPLLKLKVNAVSHVELIRAVRAQAPDARLIVDANASWSPELLEALMPELARLKVSLLEQPLAPGRDAYLAGRTYPVPLGADESCVDRTTIGELLGRYQYANLKLDKTGGLSEAIACARLALSSGLKLMVGNMCGSSLAMAPGALIATLCEFIDLDGPLLQHADVDHALTYADGWMSFPDPALWG
jgi:L-alanine-DL-glutamate epimerase-like enolase superfamily enzyme